MTLEDSGTNALKIDDKTTKYVKTNFTDDSKGKFVLENYVLKFNLSFGLNKDFDINFASLMEKNGFVNVSTHGLVNANGVASVNFSLNVKFDQKDIDDTTTLKDVFGNNYIVENKDYYETNPLNQLSFNDGEDKKVDGSKKSIAFDFKIDDITVLVTKGPIASNNFIFAKAGANPNEFTSLTTGVPTIEYVDSVKKLIVLSNNDFKISNSGNADNFSELKLIDTVLQTTYVIDCSSNPTELTINFVNPKSSGTASVKIEQTVITNLQSNGILSAGTWYSKDVLNEYFSLQCDSSVPELGSAITSLQEGLSLMNTYGLYVFDEDSGKVRFGCNPTLISGYTAKNGEITSDYYEIQNTGFQYMRVSGILNATGDVGDLEITLTGPSSVSETISFSTQDCISVESLARKISDELNAAVFDSNKKMGDYVDSIKVDDGKIVFTVAEGYSISFTNTKLKLNTSSSDDFYYSPTKAVDFETLISGMDETTLLENVVAEINNIINPSQKDDLPTLYCQNSKNEYMDHLEFRSSKGFSLTNKGGSEILEKLGFSSLTATKYGDSDYRLVGKTLLGADWSKLIKFDENSGVSFNVDLSLDLGKSVNISSASLDKKNHTVCLTFTNPLSEKSLDAGGFLCFDDKSSNTGYFKIVGLGTSVNSSGETVIDSVTISDAAMVLDDSVKFGEVDWATQTTSVYVASASATTGFVDVDLIATGGVGCYISLTGKKLSSSDTNWRDDDSFLANWSFTPTFAYDKKPSGALIANGFSVGGSVNVFGQPVDLGLNCIKLATNAVSTSNPSVTKNVVGIHADFSGVTTCVSNMASQLSNFSIENFYTLIDSLVDKLGLILKGVESTKIPVINKSIGDLVNVANDLRDIALQMREDNVCSIQGLTSRFSKYLADFGLTSKSGSAFSLVQNGPDLNVEFNIDKSFSSVHKLSFGGANGGVSGNADLKVTGDFWFSFTANLTSGMDIDFILMDAIKFGAEVDIVGEKLSFNLGIDVDQSDSDALELLKNLITVGSNGDDAFVVGKAEFDGSIGGGSISLKTWTKTDGSSADSDPSADFYVYVNGMLPISVCGYTLGNVVLGTWNGSSVDNCSSASDAKNKCSSNKASLTSMNVSLLLDDSDVTDNKGNALCNKGDLVVDFREVYGRIKNLASGNLDWFDKIKLAITGLNTLFDSLESKLNSSMMSNLKSVPMMGSVLSKGTDFLSELKNKVLDPFSKFVYETTGMTADMVAKELSGLFSDYLKAFTENGNKFGIENWKPYGDGIWYNSTNDSAEWYFRLGKSFTLGKNLGVDLGLPGLGLETSGGMDLVFDWTFEFGFGVSATEGFYFILGDGNELDVTASVEFKDKTGLLGKLAGLGLLLELDSNDGAKVEFGVDLGGSSGGYVKLEEFDASNKKVLGGTEKNIQKVALSNVIGSVPKFDISAGMVNISAGITVGVLSDVKSDENPPKFPNIEGKFNFGWDSSVGINALEFSGMKLDMGSFIGGVLGPIVAKIQKVVEPLKPLIDFLTTPFPVLDDLGIIMTPLDLAKQYSKGKFDDKMVYAIKDLIAISEKLKGGSSLKIDLGSMNFIDSSGSGLLDGTAKNFFDGKTKIEDFGSSLDSTFAKVDADVKNKADQEIKKFGLTSGSSAWTFIWDEPKNIFKLLLGQDIDLVKYDMPKLCFDFDWSTFIRIYGPLGARIGVSFNASIDLGFGYDTLGIRQWVKSDYKDFGRLLNGFYVNDLDANGKDKNELSFYGGLTAAAELNAGVSAGVGGGVGINVGFNLYDPNKDGKIRLNEITQVVVQDGLFGLFDVNGKITANLYAYVDLLFYTKKWNITGDITLFSFEYEHKAEPIMASQSGDDVVAHVGENSSSRIATDSVNVSLEDGDETLKLYIDGKDVYKAKDDGSDKDGNKLGSVEGNGKLLIDAGEGNDKIYLYGKNAKCNIEVKGGNGNDLIDLSGLTLDANYYALIWGGAGSDVIVGAGAGLNVIFGDTGVARVEAEEDPISKNKTYKYVVESNVDSDNSGDDVIYGGSNRDIILGGAGNDQIDGLDGSDIILGDGGKVEFNVSSNDVSVSTNTSTNVEEHKLIGTSSIMNGDVSVSRTDVSLDGGNDVLIGGAGTDLIYGGQGNDHIDGGAGDDLLYGGKGHDRILGGSGNDYLYGGEGMDIIFGDRIDSNSMDVAVPFSIDDTRKLEVFSQEFIEAHHFKDEQENVKSIVSESEFGIQLQSNDADMKVSYNKMENGKTPDTPQSYGFDYIYGEDGNDLLFGDDGSTGGAGDHIYGGIGNDIIDGDGGDDYIEGGIDNDVINGGAGNDIIDGGAGNDTIYGDEGVRAYTSKGDAFLGDKLIFGENLGIGGKIFKDAKSNVSNSGDDIITVGPGNNFVDGQAGNDTVKVKFMGDSTVNYTNVTDSGSLSDVNTLVIAGTENEDHILMRRNGGTLDENNKEKPADLGFVALLPITENDLDESSQNDEIAKKNINTNIERINFTNSVKTVNIDAKAGNDKIFVDGTAETTNINGGFGDDTFVIGQLYNSERKANDYAKVNSDDEFKTIETSDDQFLSDGVTTDTRLNIDGGIGNDNFVALNNKGFLNLAGGKNDDAFSLYTFRDKSGNAIERGVVSVDGGKDFDTLNIRGTDGEDTFVVTKEGMLSDLLAVKAAGVESTKFDAAAGDDMFYVLGNKETDSTELNGGKGNDTFSIGGLDHEMDLRSANTEGQNCEIDYEVVAFDDLEADKQIRCDSSVTSGSTHETFTIIDTSDVPAVFVSTTDNGAIVTPEISMKKGEQKSFFICCSENIPNAANVYVSISAPVLSNDETMRGKQGVLLSTDGNTWNKNVEVVFYTRGNVSKTSQQIFIKVLDDALYEDEMMKSLSISSTYSYNGTKRLNKSVSSLEFKIEGETGFENDCTNIISYTKNVSVSADKNIIWDEVLDGMEVSVYDELGNAVITKNSFVGKIIDLSSTSLNANDRVIVNVRAAQVHLRDSQLTLAYDDVVVDKVEIVSNNTCFELQKFGSSTVSKEFSDIVYKVCGNVIMFYNKNTLQQVTLDNVVKVSVTPITNGSQNASTNAGQNAGSGTNQNQVVKTDLLTFTAHTNILAENGNGDHGSVKYKVNYNGNIAAGKSVFVKVTPQQLQPNKEDKTLYERLFIESGTEKSDKGYIILEFTNTNKSIEITVTAVDDNVDDDYGYVHVKTQDKVIDDVDGAVFAYGEGSSIDLDSGSPAMLSYKHKLESGNGASKLVKNAASFNERNDYDYSRLFEVKTLEGYELTVDITGVDSNHQNVLFELLKDSFDNDDTVDTVFAKDADKNKIANAFIGKTLKFVNRTWTDFENNPVSEDDSSFVEDDSILIVSTSPKWIRVENCTVDADGVYHFILNEKFDKDSLGEFGQNFVFYSVNRDALFVDEAELVDRLFVNNQDYNGSDVKKSSLNAINTSNVAEKTVAGYDPHAVKFNHDDISAAGIVAAQMEYGEYNLGNSKDIVEINKTIYREDGFRTYTVVNTGAEDENGSKPFGSVVATAKMASCETNGDLFHYSVKNYVSAVTNFSYYTSEKYFVEATIKRMDEDGNLIESNVQRREIEYFFSEKDGFNIRYDFILVEGEFIDSFEFFQAEFDDEIKVNHYAADVPSVVICEGVITAAPAEEDDSANLEAEGESAEGESATSGEESDSDEEEIFGTKYYYAFSEGSSLDVYNSKMTAYETAVTAAENDGILKPSIFVDATMSDGSVQRREVSELAPDYFIIARDFTFTSENMTIESLKFGFNYNGDGQLVINAQSGNDKIDASESTIDRNDMIVFGGLGDDYITMNKGGIAFGDRGQVLVSNFEHKEGTPIDDTVLGFVENDANGSEYTTGISKEYTNDTKTSSKHRLQTDGVNRGAKDIHSMDVSHGGVDMIYVGGTDSVVIGGAKSDVIAVGGNNNVVLGDNGSVQYKNVDASNAVYGDNLNTGLHIVETTANALGSVDNVVIAGDKNVAMGGQDNDRILISGTDNIVVGDGGCYRTEDTYQVVETKSDVFGGQDFITTGDGKNIVMGGTDADQITTGKGNDVIVGDGGLVIADAERNVMFVTNEHRNVKLVDKNETLSYFDDNSAGADNIKTTGGDNVIFGGLKSDNIQSGDGQDKIFGDNGYATFRGNADIKDHFGDFELDDQNFNFENAPEVKTKSTLSFNFQGTAQNGLGEQETAGAGEYAASHWNNISGSIAGTFGNDDSEIVRFDDGTRASAVSVSYSGYESHRNTSTDNAINLQAYNLGLNGANYDSNKKLMNSGLMTTAPSDQCDNRLDVSVDGLAQYFTGFDVVVYLDIPDSHSWADQSVRRVGLWIDGIEVDAYYVNDKAGLNYRDENYVEGLKEAKSRAYVFDEDDNITGSVDLTSDSAKKVAYANYVVFHVKSDTPVDRIVVRITDGFTKDNINGKDLPGIAGIQIQGTLHKQDIAASTDITFGDKDIIHSNGGDDIVVGGTGSDEITTYGDERKGIYDNDVVFGDNAMLLFTDRDSNDNTASTLTTAESITATNKDAEYNDIINTGDGNDVVVGGIGSDTIKAGATNDAEKMLDDVKAWSLNFTNERSDSSNSIKSATYKQIDYGNYVKEADGETAGVVADNDWCNMYLKNGSLHKTVACNGNENQFKGIDVSISAYRENDWNKDNAGNYSITHENYDELDGDTANSKLFNFYLAAQQQEEMRITLRGIHNQVGDAKYDLYVYLGGDNADTDTYNYLYQISLNNSEFRYLNDWTGNTFDGDYKEATCDNDYIARCLLHDYATPRIELVGNYVVFRNLTGDVADIRIKNIYSFGGQSPKNLPVVSAIQIVSGAAKDSAAIGGDHDKDLVFGDDAKLTFDLDIPYSSEENLPDYKNRVIEAKSKDVGSLVNSVLTNDIIDTGKDRDVVVGGEDGDKITTGSGDDIAIGGGANLILEHNNPVGVFTPNTEIVLDQHTIDQTIHRNYLDNDNANIYEMQNRIDRNDNSRIRGINTNVLVENDRLDTIDAGEGRNLVSQRNTSTEKLIKEENPVAPTSDYKPSQETGDIEIGSSPVTVHILANQTIKLVCKSGYPVGNQYWTPDVKIRVNNSGNGMIPVLTWEWDEANGRHVETSNKDYYIVVNIPDHPNTDEGYVIYVTSKEDATISVTVAE